MSIIMYIKPGCPYCRRARDFYNENNIDFVEYDAQNDPQHKQDMLAFSDGDPTVPCIIQDGEYAGSGWGTPPRG